MVPVHGQAPAEFVDNHDVTRIATILTDKGCLRPIYGLLFGMPGVPSVYYGSEWGMEGDKRNGDPTLRPAVEKPEENDLTAWIAALAHAHTGSKALCRGSYRNVLVQPKQLILSAMPTVSGCWWPSTRTAIRLTPTLTRAAAARWTSSQAPTTTLAAAARWSRTAATSGNVSDNTI